MSLDGVLLKQPTLYLRLGRPEDADTIISLTSDLFALSPYSVVSSFDSVVVRENYLASLDLPKFEFVNILLCSGNEVIGFMSCGSNKGQFSEDRYAIEVGFYIKPEYKTITATKMLISAFHYWAREADCKAAFIGKMKDKKIETYKMKVLT